jgi:hypothetical protein
MAGIPVLFEKRAVTVVGFLKCQALERVEAVGEGVHVPVRTMPLAWARNSVSYECGDDRRRKSTRAKTRRCPKSPLQ